MKIIKLLPLLTILSFFITACAPQGPAQPNSLTKAEKRSGWTLLFDGETLNGWRGINRDDVPECWGVVDGELVVNPAGVETEDKGDIITDAEYTDFDLVWEWKMGEPGGNSGLKYYVVEELSVGSGGIGLEYQILDDVNHEAVKSGQIKSNDYHTLAALYEVYETQVDKPLAPLDEWNSSRIVSQNQQVEHWLNGVMVLQYTRGNEDFRERVAISKFKKYENFGEAISGHFLLQEHGGAISFRNIKIKSL